MLNPFRREQDAFKLLVVFMIGAAIVIAATLITGSSAVGIVVAFVLFCVAGVKLWIDYTRWRAEQDERSG